MAAEEQAGPDARGDAFSKGAARGGTGTTVFDPSQDPYTARTDRAHLNLTVIEGDVIIEEVDLTAMPDRSVSFGSASDNDIVIPSRYGIVSSHHGTFILYGALCQVIDNGSTNGLYINGCNSRQFAFSPGDVVSIGRPSAGGYDAIVMLLSFARSTWRVMGLANRVAISVGRAADNDLVLGVPSVSSHHAQLIRSRQTGRWVISDTKSFNGVFVSGSPVTSPRELVKGDVVSIAGATLVFTGEALIYSCINQGVDLYARELVRERHSRGERTTNVNHVSLHVHRGELVGVLGGSTSHKSELLGLLSGAIRADSGEVLVDGADLYRSYGALKNAIGLVPRVSLVHPALRLRDSLRAAAALKMPPDSSKEEREARVNAVIEQMGLAPFRDARGGSLPDVVRRRASIAMALASDPRLLFLDEPVAGLDPGAGRHLMDLLAGLAHGGRTVVLTTNSIESSDLFDRIILLGAGGSLCYEGAPTGALEFFGVRSLVEAYDLVHADSAGWAHRFSEARRSAPLGKPETATDGAIRRGRSVSPARRAGIVAEVGFRAFFGRWQSLLAMLATPIVLAGIMAKLTPGDVTMRYLVVAAVWLGLFDAMLHLPEEARIVRFSRGADAGVIIYLVGTWLTLLALLLAQLAGMAGGLSLVIGELSIEGVLGPMALMGPGLIAGAGMGLAVSALDPRRQSGVLLFAALAGFVVLAAGGGLAVPTVPLVAMLVACGLVGTVACGILLKEGMRGGEG